MNKTSLIIQREYLTRVKKRSFIIMTFLGPLLLASLMIVPIWLSSLGDEQERKIAVLDERGWYFEKFKDEDNYQFDYLDIDLDAGKELLLNESYDALLYVPRTDLTIAVNASLYSKGNASIDLKQYIKTTMRNEAEEQKLLASGIDPGIIKSSKTSINLSTIKVQEDGEEETSYAEVEVILAYFSGVLIYFFIFMFGAQLMRGVIEEKTSRIIEVIVSSVKPFELMIGKVIGIALVGLTQFLLWVVFTFFIVTVFQMAVGLPAADVTQMMPSGQDTMQQQALAEAGIDSAKVDLAFEIMGSINFPVMIFSFLMYFLGGYLLYAAFFAAIGAAVDNEADTQQFMLPVSVPLIAGIVMANYVINQPDGALAVWMSMIPLTSPIIMMVRIPFGVPYWEIGLSLVVLFASFLAATWMAAKIYRTGILMYGKKISWGELWKWLRY